MTIWLDAHLSPELGPWITERFRIEARAARDADVIVMTKDADFIGLLERFGSPPRVI